MSTYVVDASVAAKWFLEEEDTETALRVLDEDNELHAPDFLLAEADSILCKRVRRLELTEERAIQFREILRALPIHLYPFVVLLDQAYGIANRTGRSLYDCLYVVLAVLLDAPVVTADRRLYNALADGPFAAYVAWVEDVI